MNAKSLATKTPENLPSTISDDFAEFAGLGFENVSSSDILIPRLTILQSLSPQLNKKKPEYIEGAELGDIVDAGTGRVFKNGIDFLPVYYRTDYIEWAPRGGAQKLVAIHETSEILEACLKDNNGRLVYPTVLPNGNTIQETKQFYGFNLTAGRRPSFIPMASTQLKWAKKWLDLSMGERLKNSAGKEFMPPMFYRSYKLTVGEDSNTKGSWNTWNITRGAALPEIDFDGITWQEMKAQALKFREQLIAGEARADAGQMEDESTSSNGEGAM